MNIYHDVLPSVVTPCQMAEAMYQLKKPMHVPMQDGFGITFIKVSGYTPSMAEMVPTTVWKTIIELDFYPFSRCLLQTMTLSLKVIGL